MITAHQLTKRYGDKTAVADLSFTVPAGTVTRVHAPNGAANSTTLRKNHGHDAHTHGHATIDGRAYATHPAPLTEVGALLEARSVHPGRTAHHHLTALALTHGIPRARVTRVLELTGLTDVAHRRVKGFSLGMGQRLGIAAALLGDPATLILDEPVNGLDPEGVLWIRTLLKRLAAEGRTVLVSSHLMSEMALTAERLVIIGRGRLLADTTVTEFVRRSGTITVKVVTPDAPARVRHLTAPGVTVTGDTPGTLHVHGTDAEHIGRTAAAHGIPLFELTPTGASLEEAFMALTHDSVEYAPAEGAPA
jgi:ABC-2 type transport system ATP-binding protein